MTPASCPPCDTGGLCPICRQALCEIAHHPQTSVLAGVHGHIAPDGLAHRWDDNGAWSYPAPGTRGHPRGRITVDLLAELVRRQ